MNFKGQILKSVLLSVTLFAAASFGQSYQGGVRGSVTDSSGGVVPNTKVALTDDKTKVSRATLTNAEGAFAFSALEPSTYTVTAEAPGFKKLERTNLVVNTQEFLTVDLRLVPGSVVESVMVTSEVPLIENSNASNGQVLDNQKMTDLPILGRNPFLFAKLSPTVVTVGDPRFNRFQDQSGSSQISIGGGPIRGNNYLIDGVPITDSTNRAVIIPSIEAVQEVKVQTGTYDAEMGRTGGGVFNTYMKSGSNDWHGSLFGYTRQTDWLANNYFLNASGTPQPDTPFYNWGASIGGPVSIPKLYNGKNKTFFWLSDESYRQRSPLTNNVAVPTAAERIGDFSRSLTAAGALAVVKDPATGLPFTNNVIPSAKLSPIGLAVASYFPFPTSAPSKIDGVDFAGSDVLYDRADEFTAKGDHEMFPWWHVNASYLHYKSREPSGNILQTLPGTGSTLLYRKVDSTQVNNIFTPNPTTVISVRYGFNRFPNVTDDISKGYNPAALGFPTSFTNQMTDVAFPEISSLNMVQLGTNSASRSVFWSKNLLGSVAKYAGRHSLKMGIDYRLIHVDFLDLSNGNGIFFFDGSQSNYDISDLLLGYPHGRTSAGPGTAETSVKLNTYVRYLAGYVHDDFRVNSKLTLNLGLRYEYETGVQETNNNYVVGFDRTKPGVEFAGLNGYPTQCCNNGVAHFAPRIGAAYALNSKTTIRGGYGLFYAPTTYSSSASLAPGFTNFTPVVASTTTPTLGNPFPTGLQSPTGSSLGYLTGVGTSISTIDQNRQIGTVHQFSADVQRELPGHIALEVAYIGSISHHLQSGGSINIDQIAAGQTVRPFPQFTAVSLLNDSSSASYNAVVVKAQKRYTHGLTLLSAYTWSRNMDGTFAGPGNFLNSSTTSAQDIYNLGAEYSRAVNDTPQRLTSSASYDLPFGKGKAYLANNAIVDFLVGNWQLNVVNVFQTGFPLAIWQSVNNNSVIGAGVQRPNATGISPDMPGSLESRLNAYLNPAAFSIAPALTFGNVSRTIPSRGPGQANWDMSLFKTFKIGENFKAQFRAETLNTFNTPLFRGPNTQVGGSSFGKITQQANYPRYIQLGVRFFF